MAKTRSAQLPPPKRQLLRRETTETMKAMDFHRRGAARGRGERRATQHHLGRGGRLNLRAMVGLAGCGGLRYMGEGIVCVQG